MNIVPFQKRWHPTTFCSNLPNTVNGNIWRAAPPFYTRVCVNNDREWWWGNPWHPTSSAERTTLSHWGLQGQVAACPTWKHEPRWYPQQQGRIPLIPPEPSKYLEFLESSATLQNLYGLGTLQNSSDLSEPKPHETFRIPGPKPSQILPDSCNSAQIPTSKYTSRTFKYLRNHLQPRSCQRSLTSRDPQNVPLLAKWSSPFLKVIRPYQTIWPVKPETHQG